MIKAKKINKPKSQSVKKTKKIARQPLLNPKIILIASAFISLVFLALEFPWSMLISQQSQLTSLRHQISTVNIQNEELQKTVYELKQPQLIQMLAHKDFGLIKPGQTEYALIPYKKISQQGSDQIPTFVHKISLTPEPSPQVTKQSPNGFIQRFLNNLAFWRN